MHLVKHIKLQQSLQSINNEMNKKKSANHFMCDIISRISSDGYKQ